MSGKLETGSNVGKAVTQLSGVATVSIGSDDLKVDTQFSGGSIVQLSAEKNWRVYVGVKNNGAGVCPMNGVGYQKSLGNYYFGVCGDIGKFGASVSGEVK